MNPIRLYHPSSDQHFIVEGQQVYTDVDGDGKIAQSEKVSGGSAVSGAELVAAAQYFADYYDLPIHGTPNKDGTILSGGRLNDADAAKFSGDGVKVARTALERHLDFFDASQDGKITVRENFAGWRALGYGFLRSTVGTAASAVLFGRMGDGFAVDIADIGAKRPSKSTGLYDKNGEVNQALMASYLAEFDQMQVGGAITQDQALKLIQSKVQQGTVSKGQFKSLFELATRLNGGEKIITRDQFTKLFDGSLLYEVGSQADNSGKRRT